MSEQVQPRRRMTAGQQIRLESMKLAVDHWKGSIVNGSYLTAETLVHRAKVIERYIAGDDQ